MENLSQEELEFIANVLKQLSFKPGSSKQIILVENILAKIDVKEEETKEE